MIRGYRTCLTWLAAVASFVGAGLVGALSADAAGADEPDKASFYRAFNLGGPALEIDQNHWEGNDAADLVCNDARFENQTVRLIPDTDDNRTQMIRSSRWSSGGKAQVRLTKVPAGKYSVQLYVWEDNDPQVFDVRLNGNVVAAGVRSGTAGQWARLGPWPVEAKNGMIELTAEGGHANLSGWEIWRGTLDKRPLPKPPPVPAADATTLEERVAVLLARNCLECHSEAEKQGGLDLTRRERAIAGGESGPAIDLQSGGNSLLLKRVEAHEMPPTERPALSLEDRQLLADWLAAGAKWAADPIDPFLYSSDRRAGYNWWSLQPVAAVQPSAVTDEGWLANDIDRFILARLESQQLTPSPAAARRTLIRRLSFDLLGLPPSPEEVAAFESDEDPRAYEHLVDRLLASPHYGERWARHWLDIVRYGESQGFERNKLRPNAWKYRDFVAEAFNADLPYDDFVRWQIAGDVLQPDNPLAVVASGFLVVGPYDLTAYTNGTPDMQAAAREEELEGLVGTVCQTFMGLTVNCSRCHDHKFDPVTQREFYQISSALGGTYQGDERESLSGAGRAKAAEQIEAWRAEAGTVADRPGAEEARSRLESAIRLLQGGPAHVTVPRQPGAWRVLARGDFRHPGEAVGPRGIAALAGLSPDWSLPADAPEADRRRALADWIADTNNPLTARVLVNRLWGYHFGAGLVPTPSDFGFQGGQPSHPELLDWLAGEFMHPKQGPAWSVKRIQRMMVLSAAYRQQSRSRAEAVAVDAENRLVWHHPPQRLDAESFRDAVLAVSGQLNRQIGGPGYRDFTVSSAGNNETYTVFDAVGPEFNRRSLYRTWLRTGTSPLLDLLDCPDPSVATPRRGVTTTPLQALSLLNGPFIEHYAQRWAERLQQERPGDTPAQIVRAHELAYARRPSPDDLDFGQRFVSQHGLAQYCLVLFNTSEFLYVD
ncbi:MAG: DUF1553 domain-containing protein [Pirellulales bacterium]